MEIFKNKDKNRKDPHFNIVRMASHRYTADKTKRPKLILKVRCRRLMGE